MTNEPTNHEPPRFFRDILGQERVLSYLKAAMSRGRLAHAYLFLGPEGVGKESVARALAAALNCEAPREDGDACGVCPSCVRLAAGTHPDYHVLRPTSRERPPKITIEQIREFRRLTAYAPVAGGWRVALIKPGEDMREEAVNALLKTLEEPPPRHLLILTAAVEADLFPTVVSRCQKLAFTPLPYPLIQAELGRRGVDPAQAAWLAAMSGGSLGWALTIEPDEFSRRRRQVVAELEALSRGSLTAMLDWAQGLAKKEKPEGDPERRKEGKTGKKSDDAEVFILLAQLWYRDLLLLASGAPEGLLAHQDLLPELRAATFPPAPKVWLTKLAALRAAQRQLRANLNPELTLDVLGLRLGA